MKKSTRALVGMIVLDGIVLAGAAWFVWQIKTGVVKTTVPPADAIVRITTIGGQIVGVITAVLLVVWFVHRRNGN